MGPVPIESFSFAKAETGGTSTRPNAWPVHESDHAA